MFFGVIKNIHISYQNYDFSEGMSDLSPYLVCVYSIIMSKIPLYGQYSWGTGKPVHYLQADEGLGLDRSSDLPYSFQPKYAQISWILSIYW